MRDVFLGRRRGEWVAYLRTLHQRGKSSTNPNSPNYDDGMSHGIIPFGAVHQWERDADRWLAAALAVPLVARMVGWDTTGVGLAVVCPWCRQEHRHIVTENWDAASGLQAPCGKGTYQVTW